MPRFAIISAVYNVSPYLGEYIDSIESQSFPLDRVEVIMVDDGSTDDSLAVLEAWQKRRPDLVTVLSKPNGGQGSARNLGLDQVRAEWVTFTDPDDTVAPDYLQEVDDFLVKNPHTMMVATRRVLVHHATGAQSRHPLDRHFTAQNRVRNLDYDTGHFHGSAPCAFFRLEELDRERLRFDERIRPNFEDGHFCCMYLLQVPAPLVGYVGSALYLYRKRGDRTSTLDTSWTHPGRFTAVPEHGYLALLRSAKVSRGHVPIWVQGMILYELWWYFKVDATPTSAATAARGEVAERFHALLAEISPLLDPPVVAAFVANNVRPEFREILIHGYRPEPWHTPFAIIDKLDMRQRLVRVSFRFTGGEPRATYVVDGKPVQPKHRKIRSIRYFDRTMMRQRIAWVPFGTVQVIIDGMDLDVRTGEPPPPAHRMRAWPIRVQFDPTLTKEQRFGPRKKGLTPADRATLRLARTRLVRRYFANAWVLMDRVDDADDSAEHLFRYLRKRRRNINAWFVIAAGTPDHDRLIGDGYKRVIPHGSLRWKLLMLNCLHLVSSHADLPVVRPAAIARLIKPTWRFTFLQHGVIKDDLSRWLNDKDIDVFVTSTHQEHASIVGDDTPYKFTTREVKLTGLPRFDRILEEGKRFPPDKRDLILVAPTWRQWLVLPATGGQHAGSVEESAFRSSDFAAQWRAFITAPELRSLAEREGLTIGLLLHANLQPAAHLLELPADVRLLSFQADNPQQLFARARVMVTDYSSMAFNAAYIERPLVYFQFDHDRFFGGGHPGRSGYFDFERDGFGPVVATVDEAVKAVTDAVEQGPEPAAEYVHRLEQSFPRRDGSCCARVADAIVTSTKRVKWPQPVPPHEAGSA